MNNPSPQWLFLRGALLCAGLTAILLGSSGLAQTVESAAAAGPPKPRVAVKRLPDPAPTRIQHIIHAFMANEEHIRSELRHDYTYKEYIDLDSLDSDGNVTGSYQQKNDILFNSRGQRNIVCTWCPQPNLQGIGVSEQDIHDFFNMNAYAVPIHDLSQYHIRYIEHIPLDQLTAYLFRITPRTIQKGRHYFDGRVWVDDQSLQIVMTRGQDVPDEYDKHGNPVNVFLPFTTYNQPVDGLHWFPVLTEEKGTAFNTPIQLVIRYSDYKRYTVRKRFQVLPNQPALNP